MMEELTRAQMLALRNKVKEVNEKKFLDGCRTRLTNIISTKIRTAFIAPLDIFEKTFGFLWAADASGKRTSEAQQLFELYQQARTEILNAGNNQLRAAQTEIANHVVSWNRYHTEFKFNQENG